MIHLPAGRLCDVKHVSSVRAEPELITGARLLGELAISVDRLRDRPKLVVRSAARVRDAGPSEPPRELIRVPNHQADPCAPARSPIFARNLILGISARRVVQLLRLAGTDHVEAEPLYAAPA